MKSSYSPAVTPAGRLRSLGSWWAQQHRAQPLDLSEQGDHVGVSRLPLADRAQLSVGERGFERHRG